MKCGHGFGDYSQDGELARWGLGRDTKWRSCYAQKRLRNTKEGNHLKLERRLKVKVDEVGLLLSHLNGYNPVCLIKPVTPLR